MQHSFISRNLCYIGLHVAWCKLLPEINGGEHCGEIGSFILPFLLTHNIETRGRSCVSSLCLPPPAPVPSPTSTTAYRRSACDSSWRCTLWVRRRRELFDFTDVRKCVVFRFDQLGRGTELLTIWAEVNGFSPSIFFYVFSQEIWAAAGPGGHCAALHGMTAATNPSLSVWVNTWGLYALHPLVGKD